MELTPEKPLAGLLAPLFALRGENDFGIGDVGALREFVHWSSEHGCGVVQLLPINETGNDNSPYNAISSVALEPLTIEITPGALPDLTAEEIAEISGDFDLTGMRSGAVDYPRVRSLKRKMLERAFVNFSANVLRRNGSRARGFRAFRRDAASWIESYALFRALMEENGGSECWDEWPQPQQSYLAAQEWLATLRPGQRRALQERIKFLIYVQWVAWGQWRAVYEESSAANVALMGDIPFGVSYYSADVWSQPALFDHTWSGGAPPERVFKADPFTTKWGQNWGIPLYRWEAHRQQDFAWWRQRVAKVRDIFHFFRIDHILGFYRIYSFPWRPQQNADFLPLSEAETRERTAGLLPHYTPNEDDTEEHKQANRAAGEEYLKVLLQECGEFRLIGEDLGTVPDYVRPSLAALGIAGFKIPYWEHAPDQSLIPGSAYQRLSVTTYATHDHEPLRAAWEGWMKSIAAADKGGSETWPDRDHAWSEVRKLAAWAQFQITEITPFSDEIHEKLLRALLASNAWLALTMITDLFAATQRFNMPGAVSTTNWSERFAVPIAAWDRDPQLSSKIKRFETLVQETGRRS